MAVLFSLIVFAIILGVAVIAVWAVWSAIALFVAKTFVIGFISDGTTLIETGRTAAQ